MLNAMESSSLQNKILLVLMSSSVLFALVVGLVFYQNTYNTVKESKDRELNTLASETADKVDRFLFEREGDIHVLAQSGILVRPEIHSDLKYNYLNNMINAYQVYDALFVIDSKGVIQLQAGDMGKVSSYKEWVSQMLDAPFVSDVIEDDQGYKTIFYSMPLKDENGKLVGAVVEVTNFGAISEIVNAVKLGKTGHAILRPLNQAPKNNLYEVQYGKAVNAGPIKAVKQLEQKPTQKTIWCVEVSQEQEEAYLVAYRSIEIYFVFVFMIALIGFFMIAMVLTRRIAKPFHVLLEKVEGNFGRVMGERLQHHTQDEITNLSTSFDLLLEELNGLIHQALIRTGEAASAEHLKEFIEMMSLNIPNGIIAINADEMVVSINTAALAILKTERDILLGRKMESIDENRLQPFVQLVHEMLIEESTSSERQCTILDDEGNEIPLVFNMFKEKDKKGITLGTTIVLNNLEEKQQFEARIARARKYSELGELSAGVAHEIRNPLASIKGYAQLALEELEPESSATEDLKVILVETERLERLVERFLTFARPNEPKKGRHSVNGLINEVTQFLNHEFSKRNIELTFELEPYDQFEFDYDQIRQVLLNVLLNAIQASSEQGLIEIGTRKDEETGNFWLTIADHGEGISENHLKQVFEPFYTTRETGTGLGLAICARIIEKHNGHIEIARGEYDGTRVSIWLPMTKGSDIL